MNAEFSVTALAVMCGSPFLDLAEPDLTQFENEHCRKVMSAAMELHEDGKFIDPTVFPKDIIESVGIVLQDNTAITMAHAEFYLAEFDKLLQHRKSQKIGKLLSDAPEDADFDALFTSAVATLEDDEKGKEDVVEAKSAVTSLMAELEDQISSTSSVLGLRTGYKQLSSYTSGYQPGTLWILAGCPGSGKSCLALNWAMMLMKRERESVHIISMEMTQSQCIRRWMSGIVGKGVNDIVLSKNPDDVEALRKAGQFIYTMPFTICERPGVSVGDLKRQIRGAAKRGAKMIIIDHLGLVGGLNTRDMRNELGRVTKTLKTLAKKHQITVVLLSQLNRQGTRDVREGKDPTADMIAESSDPERDADVILMLDNDRHLHGVKNRDGVSPFNIQMDFQPSAQMFRESETLPQI